MTTEREELVCLIDERIRTHEAQRQRILWGYLQHLRRLFLGIVRLIEEMAMFFSG